MLNYSHKEMQICPISKKLDTRKDINDRRNGSYVRHLLTGLGDVCQVFLKLDKSAFLCASSLAPRTRGLLFLYAVEIGKEIALFSIPTATTT